MGTCLCMLPTQLNILLAHGGLHFNAQDWEGDTALQGIIERMIVEDQPGVSPAIRTQQLSCVEALLCGGVDGTIMKFAKSTSVSWALCYGRRELLILLRNRGVLPSSVGDETIGSLVGVWKSLARTHPEMATEMARSQAVIWPFDAMLCHSLLLDLERNLRAYRTFNDSVATWKKIRRSSSWPPPAPRRQSEFRNLLREADSRLRIPVSESSMPDDFDKYSEGSEGHPKLYMMLQRGDMITSKTLNGEHSTRTTYYNSRDRYGTEQDARRATKRLAANRY